MAQVDNSSGVMELRAGAKKLWAEAVWALESAGLELLPDKAKTWFVRGKVLSLWDQYGLVYCIDLGLALFHVQSYLSIKGEYLAENQSLKSAGLREGAKVGVLVRSPCQVARSIRFAFHRSESETHKLSDVVKYRVVHMWRQHNKEVDKAHDQLMEAKPSNPRAKELLQDLVQEIEPETLYGLILKFRIVQRLTSPGYLDSFRGQRRKTVIAQLAPSPETPEAPSPPVVDDDAEVARLSAEMVQLIMNRELQKFFSSDHSTDEYYPIPISRCETTGKLIGVLDLP